MKASKLHKEIESWPKQPQDGSLVSSSYFLQELVSWQAWNYNADILVFRALGTPLDWPEAKQSAHQVREWGVKVWMST